MRLKSIAIMNMAGFESFQTELPAIALIQGANQRGKTSFLDCLRYVFGRGHDNDMIHGQADAGEILITLDSGAQVKAKAVRKTNETTRSYKAPGATRFLVGRAEIDAMASAVSYDPLAFMRLDPKAQVETLLRVMPMEVSGEELCEAVGDVVGAALGMQVEGFARIDASYDHIYKLRHEVNLAADVQAKHALALEAALPPPAPEGEDWETREKLLRAELAQVETVEREQIAEIGKTFARVKETTAKVKLDYFATVDAEINAGIAELERVRASRKEQAETEAAQTIEEARTQANSAVSAAREQCKPQRDRATTELATAVERARAQQQATGTRKAADTARQEAAALKSKSDSMTAALDRLKALKETVAARLPIKGISIDGDGIKDTKQVPFGRWNTEKQMRFCLKIAVLAHGEAGFITLDGAERFDSAHRKALYTAAKKYAEEDGLQFVIATVTDGPLQITEPKPGSKCTWCAEGFPVVEGQHQTAGGPIPCLEAQA